MAGQDIWWSYWYFHLPNYALSALFYTLFARLLLGFWVRPDSRNYIYRWFRRFTDWWLAPVSLITPRALHGIFLLPIAAYWVVVVRVLLFMLLYSAGLTPRPSQT